MDFIHPLVAEKPETNVKRNPSSKKFETVGLRDICTLVKRREEWVKDCFKAGELLNRLDLDQHKVLRKMLKGKKNDYGPDEEEVAPDLWTTCAPRPYSHVWTDGGQPNIVKRDKEIKGCGLPALN